MSADEIEALLAAFTNALHPEPLELTKPEDEARYVSGLHGDVDATQRLRKDILRVQGQGVFLFTGQPGSGKSTELHRLRRDLQGRACKVYYCDLEEWLNLNAPVNLSSFLVALLSSWVEQAGVNDQQRTLATRLYDFFTKTRLIPESIKLDAGQGVKAQLQFALQSDENFRKDLEHNLRTRMASTIAQAHDFVRQLKLDLCPQGERCVLLADSIEKIRGYGDDDSQAVYDSVQKLFVSEGRALQLPGVHVVYSVSPYLLDQNSQLASSLGTGVLVNMPSVHVFERHSSTVDERGIGALVQVIEKRFPRWREVLTEAQLRCIAIDTGGDLRDLMRAIRIALTDDIETLPVDDAAVQYALDQIAPPRTIVNEHVSWMARLDRSHEAELSGAIDGRVLQRYLASKHVLAYLNGQSWYAVHPLLRDWVRERAGRLEAGAAVAGAPGPTAP